MTDRNYGFLTAYRRSTWGSIFDAYGKVSYAKRAAFRHCLETMQEKGGYAGKVCSKNTFAFTFGFLFKDETGKENLYYITKAHEYIIPIE